jgi:UDP-3-O-[3-hydroxymyristoyl] N-acetylglucosamine deacetylase
LQQQTLAQTFTLEGVGIHTGERCRVLIHPAAANTGRVFRVGAETLPAQADYVVDTTRCTTLGRNGARVMTVEHLLSALHGLCVDNAVIEVFGPEIPILDGSAQPFVEAILQAGIQGQGVSPWRVTLAEPIRIEENAAQMQGSPLAECRLQCRTTFPNWPEGEAQLAFRLSQREEDQQAYRTQIAPARTFAFQQEVEALRAAGLARGGSLDNALVINPPDRFSTPLRQPHEWCAHKLLDLIGDLALVDARLCLFLAAVRPGHRINTQVARWLRSQRRELDASSGRTG